MAPTIPEGSIVLVTGVNGYIVSHVADQLLEASYKVRGTSRDASKVIKLAALWEEKFGVGKFENVVVPDMSTEGAHDEAIKGVSGVANVASNTTFDADPGKVIPGVIAGVLEILKSASKEPSVKSFVYTYSSVAATSSILNTKFHIDSNTWNQADIKAARAWSVYGASKAEAEKALWKFVEEEKPSFDVDAVLPDTNFGVFLLPKQPASTGGWIRDLYNSVPNAFVGFPRQWFINVQDTARLHVAALVIPGVKNERLFGFSEPFNPNDILNILQKLKPDRKFREDFDNKDRDVSTVTNERAEELLKQLGRPGWTTLEQSVKNAVDTL